MSHKKSSSPFAKPPTDSTLALHPFKSHIPQADLDRLRRKLNDVEDIPSTYENSFAPEEMDIGVRKGWIEEMLGLWRGEYDWRKSEEEFNAFPHYTTPLSTGGHNYTVHFMALFSENKDAVPVIMTHGWPGSFLEFIPLFQHLTSTYTPSTLPIHLICPSLIGYGFSSPPPRHQQWSNLDVADLWDKLMRGLGFSAYVAQGGDIGSFISRLLVQHYDACKALHINMLILPMPEIKDKLSLSAFEKDCVDRLDEFKTEFAYRDEHATKPSTIGIVAASSPVALLAWIGEKYIKWSDVTPTPTQILDDVSLYYLTKTFPTSLTHYWSNPPSRYVVKDSQVSLKAINDTGKPVGYSLFKKEINPVLPKWAEGVLNLAWSAVHEEGGHFAALEQPVRLWDDIQDFLKIAWKKQDTSRL